MANLESYSPWAVRVFLSDRSERRDHWSDLRKRPNVSVRKTDICEIRFAVVDGWPRPHHQEEVTRTQSTQVGMENGTS